MDTDPHTSAFMRSLVLAVSQGRSIAAWARISNLELPNPTPQPALYSLDARPRKLSSTGGDFKTNPNLEKHDREIISCHCSRFGEISS